MTEERFIRRGEVTGQSKGGTELDSGRYWRDRDRDRDIESERERIKVGNKKEDENVRRKV